MAKFLTCKILVVGCILQNVLVASKRPNIIMIVADDLGFDDVSFHGSNQIPTPNIDKLAHGGIILDNYYVLPICSPTRSAIMTGRYPIHTGMQEDTIYAPNAWAVGLEEKFLPQYFKEQGYKTHAIGKWHLGFYAKEFTPTYRGFDSYYGYYEGKSDYYDHANVETYWGLDLHDNLKAVRNQWGNYSTEMYTAKAEGKIANHNTDEPLFIYLAYQAVHSALREDPLQAPQEWINKYKHIKHEQRRKFAAMVGYMDYGIGRVYEALKKKGILDDSIIVFTTDNGGPANGFDYNWASNYPLRGVKASLYEGGVRGASFIYSKLLKSPGRISRDLMHVTDWLPTLVKLAGGDISPSNDLDGFDLWGTLQNADPSPRHEILLNVDLNVWQNEALRVGDWKIIREGIPRYINDGWYPPPEVPIENETNDYIRFKPNSGSRVNCGRPLPKTAKHCGGRNSTHFCLFNLRDDPCEVEDLAGRYPDVFQALMTKLEAYKSKMVPARRTMIIDPRSNPKLHNGVWEPWIKLEP